jgi:GrpB-like predicted nucleotidyltransferase (UPF0157 family)
MQVPVCRLPDMIPSADRPTLSRMTEGQDADTSARAPDPDDSHDPAIRIVRYDPAWPAMFEREAAAIRSALGSVAVRVDHVGSTAVPGLDAKPIIDIQVSVASMEPVDAYRRPLEGLGYLYVLHPDFPDFPFLGKPAARPRTHHIHICEAGGPHERRHLAVRDFLRAHPEEVAAYAAFKRVIAGRCPGDRLAYMARKDRYVVDLERRALDWQTPDTSRSISET